MKQARTNPLTVFAENGIWCVRDRNNPDLISLFGTDTLPTPYRSSTRWSIVTAAIRRKNPARTIEVLL